MIINQETAVVSVAQATNEHYLLYHVRRESMHVTNNHGRITLKMVVDHDWSAGIPREQTEIDCMMLGFSLCLVVPYITRSWAKWDADYAAYCAEQEEHLPTPFSQL